jgi:multidrug efflux system membrane fusion protein
VVVADVARRDVSRVIDTIGTVMAAATVQVKSQVDGQILQAGFREGQMVKRGDLLFRIDPRPFQATLNQARAALARDRAQLEAAKADLARYGNLSREGVASAQKYEQARAQAAALTATVTADEAAIEMATLQLGYTEIRSPIDAKTGPILVDPGNLVKANDANALVTLSQIQPVRVSFSLPQQSLPELQQHLARGGQTARLTVPGADLPPVDGKVEFIGNKVDATSGTIELRATVDNADASLVPGQFVEIGLTLGTLRDALTIPTEALTTGQNGRFVWVVKPDGAVEDRPVTVVYEHRDVAVIQGQLQPGDRVVVDGQLRLARGAKAVIKNGAAAPAKQASPETTPAKQAGEAAR